MYLCTVALLNWWLWNRSIHQTLGNVEDALYPAELNTQPRFNSLCKNKQARPSHCCADAHPSLENGKLYSYQRLALKQIPGAGEKAHCLKILDLAEEPGPILSTHMGTHNHPHSSCTRASDTLFWPPRTSDTQLVHIHPYSQNTQKIKYINLHDSVSVNVWFVCLFYISI